jgi:hypothetical protein
MGEQGKDVHLRLPALHVALPVGLRVPRARRSAVEADGREPVLVPTLDVGRRLDLYGDATRVEQVVGRPFMADGVRGPDSGSDDVLREPATRGLSSSWKLQSD